MWPRFGRQSQFSELLCGFTMPPFSSARQSAAATTGQAVSDRSGLSSSIRLCRTARSSATTLTFFRSQPFGVVVSCSFRYCFFPAGQSFVGLGLFGSSPLPSHTSQRLWTAPLTLPSYMARTLFRRSSDSRGRVACVPVCVHLWPNRMHTAATFRTDLPCRSRLPNTYPPFAIQRTCCRTCCECCTRRIDHSAAPVDAPFDLTQRPLPSGKRIDAHSRRLEASSRNAMESAIRRFIIRSPWEVAAVACRDAAAS